MRNKIDIENCEKSFILVELFDIEIHDKITFVIAELPYYVSTKL